MNCLALIFEWVMGYSHNLEGAIIHVAPHIHYILWLSVSIVKNDRVFSWVSLNNPPRLPVSPPPLPLPHCSVPSVSPGLEHPAATEM